jgi:hypothetical protein
VLAPRTFPEYTAIRHQNAVRAAAAYQHVAQSIEEQVVQFNALATEINGRIHTVLAGATGQDVGESSQAWISWWNTYNELEQVDKTRDQWHHTEKDVCVIPPRVVPVADWGFVLPVAVDQISGIQMHRQEFSNWHAFGTSGPVSDPRISVKISCFVRGTLVTTRKGLTPIEQIQAGDLVLAQDVETGELDYRPVLTTTVRPPSAIRRVCLANESIDATAGHPFWVTGTGWRMAKFLAPGDRIHHLTGSQEITAVEEPANAEAINLIVGDFHTYFVGENRLLIHDGELRQPTPVVLPGYRP